MPEVIPLGIDHSPYPDRILPKIAHAYGWSDYTVDMPDEEILKRLLALNLERSGIPLIK